MNIDNGTSEDLREGTAVVIKAQAQVVEVGSNFVIVGTEDGDEVEISGGSMWFIEII